MVARICGGVMATLRWVRHRRQLSRPHHESLDDSGQKINNY